MDNNILAQTRKTVQLPVNGPALCPDGCGAELITLAHPRVTTCYCPACQGGGAVYFAGGWQVAWTPRKGAGRVH
jgi:hypothetical protein